MNGIQDEKADLGDLRILEQKLQMEIRERAFQDEQIAKAASGAERLCSRLAEDAMSSLEGLRA